VRFDANNNLRDSKPDIGAIEYGVTAVADFKLQIPSALPNPIVLTKKELTKKDWDVYTLTGGQVTAIKTGVYLIKEYGQAQKVVILK
jgi:hypothetical protein